MDAEQIYKLSDILNKFNEYMINKYEIHYTLIPQNYDSFKTMLNEYNSTNILKISTVGSDNTIYRHDSYNYKFRAVHDFIHIKHGLNFRYDAETEVYQIYLSHLKTWLFNNPCKSIRQVDQLLYLVFLEHIGQQDYFMTNKTFVPNQMEWTLNKFKGSILCD